MGIFDWFTRKPAAGAPPYESRRYQYPTGNLELAIRHQHGEDLMIVLAEVREQWRPGNEHLWDEYEPESLVDTEERRRHTVNQLLYSRIIVSRALRTAGREVRGRDPFELVAEVPEVIARLRERFPDALDGL